MEKPSGDFEYDFRWYFKPFLDRNKHINCVFFTLRRLLLEPRFLSLAPIPVEVIALIMSNYLALSEIPHDPIRGYSFFSAMKKESVEDGIGVGLIEAAYL